MEAFFAVFVLSMCILFVGLACLNRAADKSAIGQHGKAAAKGFVARSAMSAVSKWLSK